MPQMVPSLVAWAVLRDHTHRDSEPVAHLVSLPIEAQRMTMCGDRILGAEWTELKATDQTRRCGRCQEAERNHLAGRVAQVLP